MKKFLLSLFAMAAMSGAAMAEDVTFDFASNDYGLTRYSDGNTYIDNGTTVTTGGVTISLDKAEGKNGWRLWTDGLRAYKSSDAGMTITASQEISAVKLTFKSGVINGYTVNGGASTTVKGTEFTATTSGTNVKLGLNVASNGAIYTVTVTLGEGGGEDPNPDPKPDPDPDPTPDPDPIETVGDGTEANPYTVADVIALNNPETIAWVTGYIVGVINYDNKSALETTLPTTVNTCIAIAATADETDKAKVVPVQLSAGKIRTALNLVDNPDNLGRVLTINGTLKAYFGQPGVRDPKEYTLDGETPTPPTPPTYDETESLTSFVEDQPTANTTIKGTVTVFYQSPDKKYTFITDGATNLEVYGQMTNEYKNGDQLTGVTGKFGYYQNMPQMTPVIDTFGEATPGTPVEPKVIALANVQPNDYVILKGVKITAITSEDGTTTSYRVVEGETEYAIFNRFNIEGITALESADILGIGAVFGETKQIFPITVTNPDTNISEIIANGSANAAIYDLQGRRVAAPVRGTVNIINGHKVLVK